MKLIVGGGRESEKLLGMMNLPWQNKNTFIKIEPHAGMVECLMRKSVIEEALQI